MIYDIASSLGQRMNPLPVERGRLGDEILKVRFECLAVVIFFSLSNSFEVSGTSSGPKEASRESKVDGAAAPILASSAWYGSLSPHAVEHCHGTFALSHVLHLHIEIEGGLETVELSTVDSCGDYSVLSEQLKVDDSVDIPPNKQHHLLRVQVRLWIRYRLFSGIQPLALPRVIYVHDPLLIPGAVKPIGPTRL